MSIFDTLLNAPLPSKENSFLEGGDDFDFDKEMKSSIKDFDEDGDEDFLSEIEDEEEDDEEEDDEDEIDDDLDELEQEVDVNGSIEDDEDEEEEDDEDEEDDDYDDDDHYIPKSVDDPTPAEPLEGDEDEKADHMLAVVGTPVVLEECLTVEEAQQFIESGEADIAVSEGLMLESDLNEMISACNDTCFEEAVFANPKQKYKMTKKARFNQLYELSLQIEARLHHDPFYPKMQKAYKIERTIKRGWRKRYGQLAKKRAMRYLKRLMKSGSPTIKNAAKKLQ